MSRLDCVPPLRPFRRWLGAAILATFAMHAHDTIAAEGIPTHADARSQITQVIDQAGDRFVYVRSGDTLTGIAKRHSLTYGDLLRANPHFAKNPNLIQIGDEVRIPTTTTSPLPERKPLTRSATSPTRPLRTAIGTIRGTELSYALPGMERIPHFRSAPQTADSRQSDTIDIIRGTIVERVHVRTEEAHELTRPARFEIVRPDPAVRIEIVRPQPTFTLTSVQVGDTIGYAGKHDVLICNVLRRDETHGTYILQDTNRPGCEFAVSAKTLAQKGRALS